MIYLLEFVKGIMIAFGIIAGFIGAVALIIYKAKGSGKEEYEAADLVVPFEQYLKKIQEEEQYEEIIELESLIAQLKSGTVPEAIRGYKIKKDVSVSFSDNEGGHTSFKFPTTYTVIKKMPVTESKKPTKQ